MATFAYEAYEDSTKKQRKGTIEADSSEQAIERLRQQGLRPALLREQAGKGKKKKAKGEGGGGGGAAKKKKTSGGGLVLPFAKVKSKQMTTFTRQLSTLQDAGLPLLRSLQILEAQQKPGLLKQTLQGVVEEVEGGSSLSESMSKFPRAFNPLYCKMVAAGEVGGVLDVILQRLADFMEKAQRLKRKIIGALVYPVAVIVVAVLIVTGIMYFIIPRFEEIFRDFGVDLPTLTVVLTDTSRWIAGQRPGQEFPGALYILVGIPAIFVLFKLIKVTKPGAAVIDTVLLYTPVLGKLIRKTTVARFTRTLGTLISAGVPILEAITITKETCGNYVFAKALGKVHDSIREGESFAEPLRQAKVCDSIVVNMIDVGEETGDMDTMLMKIADNYDEEVDTAVASLVSLLEPLLVIVLGLIIGTIVVAMFLPLVSMIQGLQG